MDTSNVNAPEPQKNSEGFFLCGHCNHVIDLAADADPAGTFKCPRCKKHAVQWRFPSPARAPRPKMQPTPSPAVPAQSEQAHDLFASLKNAVS